MKAETEVKTAGMRALMAALGAVEAEHFVMLMQRERFDYTAWRKEGLPETTVPELHEAAALAWHAKGSLG